MNMLFVIDIGNTNITIGLYEGDRLKHTYRLTTKMKRTSDEYGFMLTNFMNDAGVVSSDVEDVIIASVVPKVMHSFRNCIRKYLHKEPIIIGPGVRTGISVQMENPKAVGADRIVDCAGAYYVYGGPALIVDFGTATTFDYVDENGVFSYGAGTSVTIRNSTITTLNDNSGGLQTTGGGATDAENCTVETSGNSSAAIGPEKENSRR